MNTPSQNPYSGIIPEDLHIAIRRAHVERAKAVRQMFAAVFAWLRKAAERRHTADAAFRAAGR